MPSENPYASCAIEPGYLANLMARLFHEVAREGLEPLGIRPEQLPILVELWFSPGASRASLAQSLELDRAGVDELVQTLHDDGLIATFPSALEENLVLTEKGIAARDPAIAAARRANDAARHELSQTEMDQFVALMNRVIDALQRARA